MYERVGSVDEETVAILQGVAHAGEWVHWDEGDRDYHTFHVEPSLIEEVLPVFQRPIQQFFIKLAPGGQVHRHVDRRKGITYHVPVQTNPECRCRMHQSSNGDEITFDFHLEVGGIYSVDRTVPHSSQNLGDKDRIHLLVEVPSEIP